MSRMVIIPLLALVAACSCNRPDPAPPPRGVPTRIVSCSPSLTEIVLALGAGDRLVAVSDHCDLPPGARALPRVGPFLAPRVETILAARPDLVLLHDVHGDLGRKLDRVRVRTLGLRLQSVADVFAASLAIGRALELPARSDELVASIDRELSRTPRAPPRRVLMVVGRDPGTMRNIFAAGPGTYLDELMRRAGATNALHDSPTAYPRVSTETIIARAPDVIIEALHPGADRRRALADWQELSSVPAVRDRRVHVVSEQLYVTPGPRLPQTLRSLAELIAR